MTRFLILSQQGPVINLDHLEGAIWEYGTVLIGSITLYFSSGKSMVIIDADEIGRLLRWIEKEQVHDKDAYISPMVVAKTRK